MELDLYFDDGFIFDSFRTTVRNGATTWHSSIKFIDNKEKRFWNGFLEYAEFKKECLYLFFYNKKSKDKHKSKETDYLF